MKTINSYCTLFLSLVAMGGFYACSDSNLESIQEQTAPVAGTFTLFANTGQSSTRITMQDDNLSLHWQLGDVLTMVNQATNDYIELTATSVDPDDPTRASFTSQYGVPAGDYWVLYNIDKDDRKFGSTSLFSIDHINASKVIKMYDIVSIVAGQASANVNMKHVYAKLTLNISNMPTNFRSSNCGIIAPKSGFYSEATLDNNGIHFDENIKSQWGENLGKNRKERLYIGDVSPRYSYEDVWVDDGMGGGWYENQEVATPIDLSKYSAFVLPTDLTDDVVYLYLWFSDNYDVGDYTVYEIKKNGLKLEAGNNYELQIDLANATQTQLYLDYGGPMAMTMTSVSSVEQLRAAKYLDVYGIDVTENFDCATGISSDPQVFPLNACSFHGNNHVISNMVIDWGYDGTGLVTGDENSYDIKDLTLQSVSVKGKDYVGAFAGLYNGRYSQVPYLNINNCRLTGTSANHSVVDGNDHVGGLASCFNLINYNDYGYSKEGMSKCSTDNYCEIKGNNYVGGLVGYAYSETSQNYNFITSCVNNAEVVATGDCVGGIAGSVYGSLASYQRRIELCGNTGSITGASKVGGIAGYVSDWMYGCYDNIFQCFNEGDITATGSKVGGIVGSAEYTRINQCRNQGNISATSYAGGIAGISLSVTNCYSWKGIVSGVNAGGISGGAFREFEFQPMSRIINCYSSSHVSTDLGILGFTDDNMTIMDCVTVNSSSSVTSGTTNFSDNTIKSVAKISDHKATLNSVDGAFSDSHWGDVYESLKLTWEVGFDAGSDLPGYGQVTW